MTDLTEIIRIIGLGEKIYLDIDSGDGKTLSFMEETTLNFVLISLSKEKRIQFYHHFEKNADPQEIYKFLLANIGDFESKLVDRIKLEISSLLLEK